MFFPEHRVVSFGVFLVATMSGIASSLGATASSVSRATGAVAHAPSGVSCSAGFPRSTADARRGHDRSGRESVRRYGLRASVVARRVSDHGLFVRHAQLVVRRSGRTLANRTIRVPRWVAHEPGEIGLEPLTVTPYPETLCIADFTHGQPVVVLGISTGNACCSALELFRVRAGGVSDRVFDKLGTHYPRLRTVRHHALLETADWLSCGITACAVGGSPLVLQTLTASHVRDVTRRHPRLLRRDASRWYRGYAQDPRYGLGQLAAWIGDQCRLGPKASPWQTVHRLLVAGNLHGVSGWPRDRRFVKVAHRELRHDGLCS
jgi:hypothetical protein